MQTSFNNAISELNMNTNATGQLQKVGITIVPHETSIDDDRHQVDAAGNALSFFYLFRSDKPEFKNDGGYPSQDYFETEGECIQAALDWSGARTVCNK